MVKKILFLVLVVLMSTSCFALRVYQFDVGDDERSLSDVEIIYENVEEGLVYCKFYTYRANSRPWFHLPLLSPGHETILAADNDKFKFTFKKSGYVTLEKRLLDFAPRRVSDALSAGGELWAIDIVMTRSEPIHERITLPSMTTTTLRRMEVPMATTTTTTRGFRKIRRF